MIHNLLRLYAIQLFKNIGYMSYVVQYILY